MMSFFSSVLDIVNFERQVLSLGAFFLTMLFFGFLGTWACVKYFPLWGLLDFPERYGLKRKKIPYPGGIFLAIVSLFLGLIDEQFLFLCPLIIILALLSFVDDRTPLSSYSRMMIHLLIIVAVIVWGTSIRTISDPFSATNLVLPSSVSVVVTIFWIMGLQQSMNWFDGLRGLTVGLSGLGFLFMGILSLVRPELFFDPQHQSLMLAVWGMAGLCLGTWWWYWQGKILLGDTGSQVLGFLLGVLSIFSGAKIGTTLMILALPLLDFVVVIVRRSLVEKKSPFQGDQKHLHHLLCQNFSEKTAVSILLFSSAVFGVLSVLVQQMNKLIGLVIVTMLIVIGYIFLMKSLVKKNKF